MKKNINIIAFPTILLLWGCAANEPYPISGSLAKINEKQILDPLAPENNAGIVNDLNGKVGEKIVAGYRESISPPKEGQQGATDLSGRSGGSGSSGSSGK